MKTPPTGISILLSGLWCLLFLSCVSADDDCKPAAWGMKRAIGVDIDDFASATARPTPIQRRPVEVGEINCRLWSFGQKEVNYYTCTKLSDKYEIEVETFFMLNPDIKLDCSNVEPATRYCVRGFIEPLRATDGCCGPDSNDATCYGTGKDCCNSETWTCGDTEEDCSAGICYEGACAGHDVFTTDGKCGYQNGLRACAGKWGDCCSMDGECGTGPDYCGEGVCASGNCDVRRGPPKDTAPLPWATGNTPDGTCGGKDGYTCNVRYGNCCSGKGECGGEPEHCGEGCQTDFGMCGMTTVIDISVSCPSTACTPEGSSTTQALTTSKSGDYYLGKL